jgi:hypothetical protein
VRISQPDMPLKLRKERLVFLIMWQMPFVVIFSTLCKLIDFKRMEPLASNSKHSFNKLRDILGYIRGKREKDTSVVLPPSI